MPDEPPKPAPAAGWYDDPDVDGGKRYWDGSKWTDQRQPPDRADEPPKPAPAEGKGSLRRWYSSLSRGVRWLVAVVVGAGAVAGAISAILALLPGPAPPLSASLSQVSVGPTQMTLDEWAQREAGGIASVPNGGTASRLAADVMVQAGEETPSIGGATPPSGPQGGGPVIQPTPLSEEERKTLKDGLDLALNDPTAPDVGDVCENDVTSPECGLRSIAATYLLKAHSPPTAESVKDQFLTLFHDMRTPLDVGQPVGAQVNVNVSSTGLSGHTANIRWTLYRVHGSDPVPDDWARGQTVLTISGDTSQASDAFWVPIPEEEGPYYVQINVVDEDGNRLDYARGKPDFGSGGAPVSADQVDGIQFAPFIDASAFTVDAPNWEPTVIEESLGGGVSLTVLVSPDEDMMVQIQQAPEEPASAAAHDAQNERVADGDTDIHLKSTTIAGRTAYRLRFIHDEESKQPYLPDIGEVYGSTYFFNDSGFTWRVRAAVKTTVPDGKKRALEIATKMATTFASKS
jgi:hypothetical protein